MKRSLTLTRLPIGRETVRTLSSIQLGAAWGGSATGPNDPSNSNPGGCGSLSNGDGDCCGGGGGGGGGGNPNPTFTIDLPCSLVTF